MGFFCSFLKIFVVATHMRFFRAVTIILVGFIFCNCAQPVPSSFQNYRTTRGNIDPKIEAVRIELKKNSDNYLKGDPFSYDPRYLLRRVNRQLSEISNEPKKIFGLQQLHAAGDINLDRLERDIMHLEEVYPECVKIKNHLMDLERKLGDEFNLSYISYSGKYDSYTPYYLFVNEYEKAAVREKFNKKLNERVVFRTEQKNKEDLLRGWASERRKIQKNLISQHVGAAVTDNYSLSIYALEKRWVTFFIKATGNKIIRFRSRGYTKNELTGKTTGYWSGYSMKDNHGNHYKFEGISGSTDAQPGKFSMPRYRGRDEVVLRPGQGHLMIAQFSDYPVQSDSLTISAYPSGLGRHDFKIPTEIWHQCSDVPINPPASFTPN